MKSPALLLVALSLLLGACSSFRSPPPVVKRTVPPAVRAENIVTAFGEFPSYKPEGQNFKLYASLRDYEIGLTGRAVVDVIVNADGTVQDAAIVEASGNPTYDEMALRLFRNSRYTLRLAPGDPAPYVVRQEFVTPGFNARSHVPSSIPDARSVTGDPHVNNRPMGEGAKHWTDK